VQRGPPASTPTTVMPSVKLVFQPVIVVRSRTATSSSWRTVPNRGCATLRSRLGNIPDGSDTNTVIEDLHVAAGGDAGAQWPNRAPLSAAHTVVGRSDACGDAAKNDQNRRATLTNVGVSYGPVNLRCKHGWLSHVTARPKGLRRRKFESSPRASSSAQSVAAGPVTVDHPVDVPRRIERPGVLASATPTASCVSLCESCGLMRIPPGGWVCVAGLRRF
jgi:hypothetical protein